MAEKLKIIALGGLNEIGKNMTAYEYGGEIIVVDCGMAFPGDDMYGIDLIIPDVSYLIKNRSRIRGLFITHGHEDHTGSLPYLLQDLNNKVPIFSSKLTLGFIEGKLSEFRIRAPKFREVSLGELQVRQVYKISNVGTVAGCRVTSGKITRDSKVRVVRDGIVICEDSIASLKRFKDDAKEVAAGFECGITLAKFQDIKEGDVFECFKMEEYRD